jgi:hypothetical protein
LLAGLLGATVQVQKEHVPCQAMDVTKLVKNKELLILATKR